MVTCLIAAGANLGQREETILAAVERLAAHPQIEVLAVSSLHETTPVGGPLGQGNFLNAAIQIKTSLSAQELLQTLLTVETQLGRVRKTHWGPRTIDLDLLLYGVAIIEEPDLHVPHPLMHTRHFVLAPAAEIASQMLHPRLQLTVGQILSGLDRSAKTSP